MQVGSKKCYPPPFQVGDRVHWSFMGKSGDMGGEVVKVTPKQIPTGSAWYLVRVRWDSGAIGSNDDRVLKAGEPPPKGNP